MASFDAAFEWHREGCKGWAQAAIMVHQCVLRLRISGNKYGPWSEPEWHGDGLQQLLVAEGVCAVSSDDDGAWDLKADAYKKLGQKQAAREAYERARSCKQRGRPCKDAIG